MTLAFLPRARRAALLAAVAAVAVPVAGCGSGDSSSGGDPGADPAASLPASAPLYAEAQLQPQGDQRDAALAVGRKLLRTQDPAGKLVAIFDKAGAKHDVSYAQDIKPWLGNRVGVALTAFRAGSGAKGSSAKPDFAVAIASKDDDKAKAFVSDQQKHDKASERAYNSVTYGVDADGTASTVLGHTVIVGTESGLKAAIDASKGDSLAKAAGFREARDEVGTDGLAYVYVDPKRLLDAVFSGRSTAGGPAAAGQAQALSGLLGGSGLRSIAASLTAAPNALRVDAAAIGAKPMGTGAGDGPAAAAAVPADAWLSAGIGDLGGTLRKALDQQAGGGGIAGLSVQQLEQQLKTRLGIDLQKDFLSWMGDGALFVRGTSHRTVGGALVVDSKDPSASQAAIGKLEKLLTTFGQSYRPLHGVAGARGITLAGPGRTRVQIAAKGDKFVIALGPGALAAALRGGGGDTLGDTGAFKSAAGLLEGAKPSFFLDTPSAVKLLQSFAGDKPDFQKAKPTLDVFGPAAAGLTRQGDVPHLKAAVGIR
jgi:hypothetical protein